MKEHPGIQSAIDNIVLGQPIAVKESCGQGYRITLVASVTPEYITLKSDSSWKFHRETGHEVDGVRRLCPVFQAKLEEKLYEMIDNTAFTLSVEKFEECFAALREIMLLGQ